MKEMYWAAVFCASHERLVAPTRIDGPKRDRREDRSFGWLTDRSTLTLGVLCLVIRYRTIVEFETSVTWLANSYCSIRRKFSFRKQCISSALKKQRMGDGGQNTLNIRYTASSIRYDISEAPLDTINRNWKKSVWYDILRSTSWFKLIAPRFVGHECRMQHLLECHIIGIILTACIARFVFRT